MVSLAEIHVKNMDSTWCGDRGYGDGSIVIPRLYRESRRDSSYSASILFKFVLVPDQSKTMYLGLFHNARQFFDKFFRQLA